MVKVTISFGALAWCSHGTLDVAVTFIDGDQASTIYSTSSPAAVISELVNKYGKQIETTPSGYAAQVSNEVARAIWFASSYWRSNNEEINALVNGELPPFLQFINEITSKLDEHLQTFKPISHELLGKKCQLNLSNAPSSITLTLISAGYSAIQATFKYNQIKVEWLKKIMREGADQTTWNLIEGLGFLLPPAQKEAMCKLSEGTLSLVEVAAKLTRSGIKTLNKTRREKIIVWLTKNKFQKEADTIVIHHTLLKPLPNNR